MHHFKQDDAHNEQKAGARILSVRHISDEHLLAAIASGDIEAMEILYQRYSRVLYSLAYRMVADQQVAEDLVQEAFLAVWRRASSYAPHAGAARSWLFSIVHHRTIDYLRTVHRRSVLTQVTWLDAEQDEHHAVSDVWEKTWLSVQSTQMREALAKLAEPQRQVIELAYFQGWTQAEIAQMYQIPLGTVKRRLQLGLMHLRRLLAQMEVDGQ